VLVQSQVSAWVFLRSRLSLSKWARPDSNRRPPPCKVFRLEVGNPIKLKLKQYEKLSNEIIQEYLEYRYSRIKAKKSKWWIEYTVNQLIKHTKRKLTKSSILKFQNWYKQNYQFEGQSKFHTNTKNFLEWLYKMTGNSYYRELQELLEPPVRPSKKLNPILIREDDVKNLISALWELDHYSESLKIKYTTAILFLAYTGQRPDATASKITVEELREAIERDPPMLWIPEEKDKENFPHWIPIHPVLKEWIVKMFKTMDHQVERPFNYDKVKKAFDEVNVKAIHTGRKITPSHLRKFFEQMCNNVLVVQLPDGRVVPAMHPGLRDYIMAHNTGSLDVQSYDGKLPSEIYEQYMAAWGKVDLRPATKTLMFYHKT